VGVFLPSISRTPLDFLREILKEEKLHLKQNEVVHLDVPRYSELSVKNLFDDALGDEILKMYLPTKKQLSNKFPEREFFFGVLATMKRQYLTDVIRDANNDRFKAQEDSETQNRIVVSSSWMDELTAHPYYSSKYFFITKLVGKPGTAIHLLKERAKLQRDHSARKVHHLSKRLSSQVFSKEEEKQNTAKPEKRPNLGTSHQ
jgi:hypothetical protein